MNADHRIYRRSTLLQFKEGDEDWRLFIDSLEVKPLRGSKDERFQLVERSALQIPCCSFISRTDDDVWFIDTGVDFDGGRMYIGQRDLEGLASIAGYVSLAYVGNVEQEKEDLKRDLDSALHLIVDLRAAIASLVGAETVERGATEFIEERGTKNPAPARRNTTDVEDLDLDLK